MISVACKEDRGWDPEHKGPADSGVVKVEVQGINVAVKVQPPGDWALMAFLVNPDSAEEIAGALVTMAGIVRRQAAAAKAEKKP
jgi:hypothetical protein